MILHLLFVRGGVVPFKRSSGLSVKDCHTIILHDYVDLVMRKTRGSPVATTN